MIHDQQGTSVASTDLATVVLHVRIQRRSVIPVISVAVSEKSNTIWSTFVLSS